jgi:hypothetical protein
MTIFRLLYWSERSNSSSVSVMSVVGLGGAHTLNLTDGISAVTSYGFYQVNKHNTHSLWILFITMK